MKSVYFFVLLCIISVCLPLADASAQITRTFDYFAEEFDEGQSVSLSLHFYRKYAGNAGWKRSLIEASKLSTGDRYSLFAYMPQFVTIENGKYTVEIPRKYYNKNYFLEIIFDIGYVSPRISLDPISEYTPKSAYVVFGALFIALFAWMRFNTWTDKNISKYSYSPRNFTTWIRFIRSALLYTLITEIFFILLVISPGTFVFVNKYIGGSNLEYNTLMELGQYSVLWSIFIIAGILPNFPWINKLEMRFREIMHDFAFIPAESRAVISQLEINYSAFKPNDKIIARVLQELDYSIFREEHFQDIGNSIQHKWCKLSYLNFRLKEWKTFPKINHFFGSALEKFNDFLKQYESLSPEIKNYGNYIKTINQNQNTNGFLSGLEQRIDREINILLSKAYSLISIGALATERLPQGRRKAFKFFGLEPYLPDQAFVDWDTNLKSVAAIIISAGLPTVFYYFYFILTQLDSSKLPPLVPSNSGQALLWTIACVLMHSLTVFSVVFFNIWKKRLFTSKYEDEGSSAIKEKNRFVRISGGFIIGFFISFIVLVSLFILPHLDKLIGNQLVDAASSIALWSTIAAVTGAFVQYYLEVSVHHDRESWKESLMQGAATALAASLVAIIFLDKIWMEVWYFIFFAATNSFLIGASIGYIFPKGYRRRYKKMSNEDDRRFYERKKVMEPVTLHLDNAKYACNMMDISLGGAKLDRIIKTPIGSTARIELQPIGDLNAVIVRKANKNTYIHFPYLDNNSATNLEHYLQGKNLIKLAELKRSRNVMQAQN